MVPKDFLMIVFSVGCGCRAGSHAAERNCKIIYFWIYQFIPLDLDYQLQNLLYGNEDADVEVCSLADWLNNHLLKIVVFKSI